MCKLNDNLPNRITHIRKAEKIFDTKCNKALEEAL